jgi:hypothetical protein
MSESTQPEPFSREWTKQQLTEQAVAQESATESLADEMMRIRKDLEKLTKITAELATLRDELRKANLDIQELKMTVKYLMGD